MEPTHIIVPIKEIRDRIKSFDTSKDSYDIGEAEGLETLLNSAKKISLTEDAIEEKANDYALKQDFSTTRVSKKQGYKQALRDLLNL